MAETAASLQLDDQNFIQSMTEYIKTLRAQTPEIAREEARNALYRTGVTTKDGKLKDSIVSWE